jgi:hypothetical protein
MNSTINQGVTCQVTNCSYHQANSKCGASCITVNGGNTTPKSAKSASGTACDTFKARSDSGMKSSTAKSK